MKIWIALALIGASCANVEPDESGKNTEAANVDDPTEGGDTTCNDPLLLDLGTGVAMSDISHGAVFDADNDGTAHKMAWPIKGAWLAYDVNHNGLIDSGAELFGSASKKPGGLASLLAYDNGDLIIDADDAIFASLLVWEDKNRDGHTQSTELMTLADLGIQSIGLDYQDAPAGYVDTNGNQFQGAAKVTLVNGAILNLWGVIPTKTFGAGGTTQAATCPRIPDNTCVTTCYGTLAPFIESDGSYSYSLCGPPGSGFPFGSAPVRVSTFRGSHGIDGTRDEARLASKNECKAARYLYVAADGTYPYQSQVCMPTSRTHALGAQEGEVLSTNCSAIEMDPRVPPPP